MNISKIMCEEFESVASQMKDEMRDELARMIMMEYEQMVADLCIEETNDITECLYAYAQELSAKLVEEA